MNDRVLRSLCRLLPVLLAVGAVAAQESATLDGKLFVREDGVWFQEEHGVRFRVEPDVVSVRFLASVEREARATLYSEWGTTVIRENRLEIVDLEVPEGQDAVEFVRGLQESGKFEFAELNTFGSYVGTPNDPLYPSQWGVHNTGQTGGSTDADIDAPEAWDIALGHPSIVVGVLDSGSDIDHDDLGCNIWVNPGEDLDGDGVVWDLGDINGVDDDGNGRVDDIAGWDFFNSDNDPRGPFFHGTHVAGIVGACSNNGVGIAGVAGGWAASPGVGLLIVGVGDSAPSSSILDDSILYAAGEGARVITMSLTVGSSSAINAALNSAYADGVFINNASGNSSGAVGYPSTQATVMAVGATDHNDNRATFSNFGPTLEIVAPGVSTISTQPGNVYGSSSGTSFASPHVAGVAGLMFSASPSATNDDVRGCLTLTADDQVGNPGEDTPGRDDFYGHGRLNAAAALACIASGTPGEVPPTLQLARSPSSPNEIVFSWDVSCAETVQDYGIYSGILGFWTSHNPVTCTDAGGDRTERVQLPFIGNRYFLVVPMDFSREGSFGTRTDGTPRPAGQAGSCRGLQTSAPCR